jgi:hypothetical protein
MRTTITLQGKPVRIELSSAAQDALGERQETLLAEMELYFSCLIRKKVRFRDANGEPGTVRVGDGLHVRFRPIMTAHCGTDYEGDEPPVTDFPIANPEAFVPGWLRIDFRRGQWHGDFGF